MTSDEFADALEHLRISRNGAAAVLGVGRSTVYRYLNGTDEIPVPVERLLILLQERKRGVPEDWRA